MNSLLSTWKVASGWGRVSRFGRLNARLWEGCGGQRTLSRNRGWERMVGARVEGGNEFPSQYMEVLRTGADDSAWGEVRFGVGEGEKPSTNEEPRINEWTARGRKVTSRWGRVSVSTGLRPSLWSQRKALGGVWRSMDTVTESRTGTDGRRAGRRRESISFSVHGSPSDWSG